MLAPKRVSRTEEKAGGGLSEAADGERASARDEAGEDQRGGETSFSSGASGRSCLAEDMTILAEESCVADETMRTRLIGDIVLLLRDTATPETARVAGLTFVGWLARRRLEEAPHAAGVDEARESERRLRSARAKTR
jgi:hypothetical protein